MIQSLAHIALVIRDYDEAIALTRGRTGGTSGSGRTADMRTLGLSAAATMLLVSCGSRDDASRPASGNESEAPPAANSQAPATPPGERPAVAAARWDLQASTQGITLALLPESGPATIRFFCHAAPNRLLRVYVDAFRMIGSEDRLSFGSGGEAVALAAATARHARQRGVSAGGPVPANLEALLGGPVSASYGAQTSGPHPALPQKLARDFAAACRGGAAAAGPAGNPPAAPAGPCSMQDGERLRTTALRAIGTEPFWGARIEGRCVTYSHPEDQKGTRVWTRFTPGPNGGGTWSGALGGQRFELRTRAQPGCSDGMSDKVYPIAVDLLVGGERRSGCAEPI